MWGLERHITWLATFQYSARKVNAIVSSTPFETITQDYLSLTDQFIQDKWRVTGSYQNSLSHRCDNFLYVLIYVTEIYCW